MPPQLDVSFLTGDPMLSDTFDVKRHLDDVDEKGRTRSTADELFEDVVGVVTWADPADLARLAEGQTVPRGIFVATSFPLRGAVNGNQPDRIVYLCEEYMVKEVKPYSRFGEGTYEAIAVSTTAMDEPIDSSD